MESKLKGKDLVISFKTASGKLQAVRNISFDLYKGEMLAIVGESGSGKSVTSRAIMGILANNAIVDGGKILYGDKDLLKISEEESHKIRGDKIAMVFQDPLSSLNPIMKVGKQLTEAMLLKNKASRRESKAAMKQMFKALETNMAAVGEQDTIKADLAGFKEFETKHCELESVYQRSIACAQELLALSENLSLRIRKNSEKNLIPDMKEAVKAAKGACSRFVIHEKEEETRKLADGLIDAYNEGKRSNDNGRVLDMLSVLGKTAGEALEKPAPDTFSLGYYLTRIQDHIPEDKDVNALNAEAGERMKAEFLDGFLGRIEKAVRYSAQKTDKARSEALKLFNEKLPEFEGELEKTTVSKTAEELKKAVAAGIVEYLKKCAAESVHKVSRSAAKERAIKLMESVGIDEPRRRSTSILLSFPEE